MTQAPYALLHRRLPLIKLQDIPVPLADPEVHIAVSPASATTVVYPFSADGPGVYSTSLGDLYYPTHTELTFSIVLSRLDPGDVALVRWNLGDGRIAYGPTVAHTYALINPVFVSCAMTDTKGRTVYSGKQLYFLPAGERMVAHRALTLYDLQSEDDELRLVGDSGFALDGTIS